MSTFPLRDFLTENREVRYDLASSSVREISHSESLRLKKQPGFEYTDELDKELRIKISAIYGISTDRVIPLSGAQVSNSLVLMTLFKPGDEIIVESPNYRPLVNLPRRLGLHVKTMKRSFEDDFRIKLDDLKGIVSDDTKAVILTNPHNPSGKYLNEDELTDIQRYLQDREILLIVDEIFKDFIEDDFSAIDLGYNVIITSSLSKVFGMGGVRIGWTASRNKSIMKKINSMKYDLNILNSTYSERLAINVIEKREVFLKEVRGLAKRNLSMVTGWVEGNEFVEWVPPTGGIISFPKLRISTDSLNLSKKAIEEGVLVAPGNFFSEEDTWDDHIRLCFGLKTEDLALGLQRLSRVINRWV